MKNELKRIGKLSLPLIFAQIGVVLLGVTDMVMLGHYSDVALKAAGLANVWIIGTLMFGIGCSLGIDPVISKLLGEGSHDKVKVSLISAKVLAVVVAIITGLLWAFTGNILQLFGQDPLYSNLAHEYALVQIPSLIPFFMYMVFRQYMIAHERTLPVAVVLIITNVINIILNWVFIYGVGPVEEMGLYGAGLSSCIMRAAQYILLCLIVYYGKSYKEYWVKYSSKYFDRDLFKKISLMGLPIGIQLMLEAFGLQMTTFMAGRIGSDELGAHTVILNLQYLFFILPMSFSLCAATRVGFEVGMKNKQIINVYKALVLVSIFAFLISSFTIVFAGESLIKAYGVSHEIIILSKDCLTYSAIFLFFYGLQLLGTGFLRGAGKTMSSSLANIVSLYICALPMSYFLAIDQKWGLSGIWAGLSFGMIVATSISISLNIKFYIQYKESLLSSN
ncbi:MATE family efflux transporter [Halobacteriovorax sp.]|uniref:MATE family efflux transporter n=1 Tax=Halobacteriovorax sp. TaxID=2020862 RepID=UPI00356683FE